MASPTDIPNLVLWFRASDLSAYADGTAMDNQWSSVVGSSTTTQITTASQPTKQTVGADSVVRFDGTDDWLRITTGAALTATQNKAAVTIFAKAKVNTIPAATGLFFFFSTAASTTSRCQVGIAATTGVGRIGGRRLDADALQSFSGTLAWDTTDVHVQTSVYDWANASAYIYLDGALSGSNTAFQTAGNSDTTASGAAAMGAANSATSLQLACDLYDVIVYDRVLTSGEQQTVEDYLLGISSEPPNVIVELIRSQ